MTRVLVTGANGQLGLALQDAAKDSNLEIVFMDKNSLDITNTKAINEVFATQSFDACINTAAYTDCLLYTSPSPRDGLLSRMPSSA